MKVRGTDFQTTIPDGWRDESTFIFSMPPDQTLSAPLAGQSRGPSNANVTILREERADSPAETLEDKLARLRQALPGLRLRNRGEIDDLSFAEWEVTAHVPLVQIMLVRRIDAAVYTVTGTAVPAIFNQLREAFVTVATSLEATGSPFSPTPPAR